MIQRPIQFNDSLEALHRIYMGTLKSLQDRVLPSGFCHTSYGEENGVKCYGDVHYPRDAAEAARVLALTGNADKARSILEFTLQSTPENQRYIPHVLGLDGSIIRNTIQVDTPAHNVLALDALWHSSKIDRQSLRPIFTRLAQLSEWIWDDHFHADWNLLDAGNYNEQGGFGGSSIALMDMFTNASCFAMYNALATMADDAGFLSQATEFRKHASQLHNGILQNLLNPENGMYYQARHLSDGHPERDITWLCLYPVRWYHPDLAPYRRAYDVLWTHACNNWNGLLIPSLEKPALSFRTMGKCLAVLLGFAAEINDTERLERLLDFIRTTVRRPDDIWPEFWYHHPTDNDYYNWLFNQQFPGIWSPFTETPDGDYTVDSGNCEQSAVFCQIFLRFFS